MWKYHMEPNMQNHATLSGSADGPSDGKSKIEGRIEGGARIQQDQAFEED